MSSHLVEILLPVRTGNGELVTPARFEELLHELTDRFGGATSPGRGLWAIGGDVEPDNIAVIEVMTDELDRPYWKALRLKLERELSQEEIVIRAQEISRL
jgi:hypothetical protein